MNKINYPKIEEYNKKNDFYDYIKNYIEQFKNKKDKIELSYLCAKETLELTKENEELYKNCVKCLELVKLWLKDENFIGMQELKEIVSSISYPASYSAYSAYSAYFSIYSISECVYSIYYSVDSIYYSVDSIYYSVDSIYYSVDSIYSVYYTHEAKPELLPYIQKLIQMYLKTEKQFNIIEHNNTYHENILKQIISIEYDELQDIDKNQVIDIINEYYNIEIDCFDFIIYKTLQREFI